MDGDREVKNADGFLEERGLFASGFRESHGDLRAANRNGNTGKAGPGTEVEKGRDPGGKGAGAGDGFDEMAGKNAVFIPDCGQVDACIPAKNKRTIRFKCSRFNLLKRLHAGRGQQPVEANPNGLRSGLRGRFRFGVEAHSAATDSSTRGGCQAPAARTKAAKMAREKALSV